MGTLCKEFEMMRSDLSDNNRKMWRMIDDEKALRQQAQHPRFGTYYCLL